MTEEPQCLGVALPTAYSVRMDKCLRLPGCDILYEIRPARMYRCMNQDAGAADARIRLNSTCSPHLFYAGNRPDGLGKEEI